jgi:hypothetical protein
VTAVCAGLTALAAALVFSSSSVAVRTDSRLASVLPTTCFHAARIAFAGSPGMVANTLAISALVLLETREQINGFRVDVLHVGLEFLVRFSRVRFRLPLLEIAFEGGDFLGGVLREVRLHDVAEVPDHLPLLVHDRHVRDGLGGLRLRLSAAQDAGGCGRADERG